MKKTSFLKKLTAMAATLAMTCVMAVGAFAAEPAVDYKLDSASISVGETWTMSVPAGGMYDWNLSSEYIAYDRRGDCHRHRRQRRARHAQRRYAEHRQQGFRNARRNRRTVCRCSGEHRPR